MSVALFKRYYLEFRASRNAYSAGLSAQHPSPELWRNMCSAFYELSPNDSFGVCHCGGELFWTKKQKGWAAICNRCHAEEFRWNSVSDS
jgi:hypothetical protein